MPRLNPRIAVSFDAKKAKVGETWVDRIGPATIMAVADNWAMLRRPGAITFIVWVPDLISKWGRVDEFDV